MPTQQERRRRYHLLTDSALAKLWKVDRDVEAYGVLEDRRIVRNLATNPRTEFSPHQVPLDLRFWLLFRKDGAGRVALWLELKESTTVEKIKEHWQEIRQWQDFLRDWQGPEKSGPNIYIKYLHQKHKKGFSYAALAKLVADEALYRLLWYRGNKLKKFEKALARIDNWSDEETQHWASECSAALQLFTLAGGRDEVLIHAWWKDALKHLASNNKRPITADIPVTRENIIETLKAFRKRFKIPKGVGKIG